MIKHSEFIIGKKMNIYRIKLLIAMEQSGDLAYLHEIMLPGLYQTLEEAHNEIKADIYYRMRRTLYFRAQRHGFDIVRYNHAAQRNTLLAWRVVPVRRHSVTQI